jgi:hypothetical protein
MEGDEGEGIWSMYVVSMYEKRTMKSIEIVLRWRKRG